MEITDTSIWLQGKINEYDTGINDYSGVVKYVRPPYPEKKHTIGRFISCTTPQGIIAIQNTVLITDQTKTHLYIAKRILKINSDDELDRVINSSNTYKIILISLPTCPNCKKAKKVIDRMTIENPYIDYYIMPYSKDSKYCKNIDQVPTYLIYYQGKCIYSHTGLISSVNLLKNIIDPVQYEILDNN